MLYKLRNKLYKALLFALSPKVSLLGYVDRKIKANEFRLSEEAKKKADEAVSTAIKAAPKKEVVYNTKNGDPVVHVGSKLSLKDIKVSDYRAGFKIADIIKRSVLDDHISCTVNAAIYLSAISQGPIGGSAIPGKVKFKRTVTKESINADGSENIYVTIDIGMYAMTKGSSDDYSLIAELTNNDKLGVDSALSKSFTIGSLVSEYECFQGQHGFCGNDFPIDSYNSEVMLNTARIIRTLDQASKYALCETVEFSVDHSASAKRNSISACAVFECGDNQAIEVARESVRYSRC